MFCIKSRAFLEVQFAMSISILQLNYAMGAYCMQSTVVEAIERENLFNSKAVVEKKPDNFLKTKSATKRLIGALISKQIPS